MSSEHAIGNEPTVEAEAIEQDSDGFEVIDEEGWFPIRVRASPVEIAVIDADNRVAVEDHVDRSRESLWDVLVFPAESGRENELP